MSMQNMKRSETTEQIALFNWAKRTESILPELALMYHVPNEGKRSNGGILKAAGLKSGVPGKRYCHISQNRDGCQRKRA